MISNIMTSVVVSNKLMTNKNEKLHILDNNTLFLS